MLCGIEIIWLSYVEVTSELNKTYFEKQKSNAFNKYWYRYSVSASTQM